VASVDYSRLRSIEWEQSRVWRKLNTVLWVPLLSGADVSWEQRRVGRAYLWSPDVDEEAALRQDWEQLQSMMMTESMSISAHAGAILQLRPKAAHGKERITTFDEEIGPRTIHPQAYYLRARFTESLLWRLSK